MERRLISTQVFAIYTLYSDIVVLSRFYVSKIRITYCSFVYNDTILSHYFGPFCPYILLLPYIILDDEAIVYG